MHGLWQHGLLLGVLSYQLTERGIVNQPLSYDFLNQSPLENADALYQSIRAEGCQRINLVGHSLGGIVILHLLRRHPELPVGRVVLIGSPVRGSSVAERIYENKLLRYLLGRSVEQGLLGGAPDYSGQWPLGIITGSGNFGISALLYGAGDESDGVVQESETELEHVTDRIRLPYSHSNIVFSRRCAAQVAAFLTTGRFQREGAAPT